MKVSARERERNFLEVFLVFITVIFWGFFTYITMKGLKLFNPLT